MDINKLPKKMQKAIEQSKQYLDEGEEIKHAIMGAYEADWMGQKIYKNNALFLATNKKLFFYAKKLTGYESETFPYSKISSFESGKKMLGHYINFYASGNKVSVKHIQTGDIGGFISYVKAAIEGAPINDGGAEATNTNNAADEIKKLAELKDSGVITEEEFNAKKKQLLGL